MPRDAIQHRPGCDRPTGPTGTEAACSCAMYQGQFPPPDGYEAPEPTERERELALDALSAARLRLEAEDTIVEDLAEDAETAVARVFARYREELRRG